MPTSEAGEIVQWLRAKGEEKRQESDRLCHVGDAQGATLAMVEMATLYTLAAEIAGEFA